MKNSSKKTNYFAADLTLQWPRWPMVSVSSPGFTYFYNLFFMFFLEPRGEFPRAGSIVCPKEFRWCIVREKEISILILNSYKSRNAHWPRFTYTKVESCYSLIFSTECSSISAKFSNITYARPVESGLQSCQHYCRAITIIGRCFTCIYDTSMGPATASKSNV
jgi:hypothetical protein